MNFYGKCHQDVMNFTNEDLQGLDFSPKKLFFKLVVLFFFFAVYFCILFYFLI